MISHSFQSHEISSLHWFYVTINSHRGLIRYTHLPFGIASAPTFFQKATDTILQGLLGVVCYLDDILVTGYSDAVHQQNLEQVLKWLQFSI